MLGYNWYFGLVRNYVVLFGSLFNDIEINRVDTDGNNVQTLKIPLSYGPKERYLTREAENPDLLRPISYVFPRMAFEITDFRYDSDRKLNSQNKSTTTISNTGNLQAQLNPVPYNLGFKLSIISRNTDDALRIVEQILPYFTPTLNTSINLVPEMNYGNTTIPITLNSVAQEELYEGSFDSKEYVVWTLDFTLKGWFYGPMSSGAIIKEITINFDIPSDVNNTILPTDIGNTPSSESINITPGLDANGNPTSIAANSIPISQISANSNYGFIVDFING